MGLLRWAFKRTNTKAAAKAAFAGNFEQAFTLIDKGADINASCWIGDPDDGGGEGNIGYSAIKHGNLKALEQALERGLDPNLQSPYRQPLVIFAIQNKQEDAAKLLVERGADVSSYLLGDFFSPLALTRIYKMPELEALIASKLTPEQLRVARAADFPWAADSPAESEKPVKPATLNL